MSESRHTESDGEPSRTARAAEVAFERYSRDLRLFLIGILRDHASADDALQSTFAKLLEQDHPIEQERMRAWLFRVAYNEAMLQKRRVSTATKHSGEVWRVKNQPSADPADQLVEKETEFRVRRAIEELSADQRMLVITRIQGDLKFREIAEMLNVPLGTVLGRMQSALKKLKERLSGENESR